MNENFINNQQATYQQSVPQSSTGQQQGYQQTTGQQTYQQFQQSVQSPIYPSVQPQPYRAKKGNGFGQKIAIAIVAGIFFGLAAAGGVYGINRILGNTSVSTNVGNDTSYAELQKEIDSLKNSINAGNDIGVVTPTSGTTVSTVVTDVTEVVDKVMPSMVSITNLYTQQYNYWGRVYTEEYEASGSGFIIGENDSEIIIVTNYHVIENNVQLTVSFVDESQARAYLKGGDQSIDIAVLGVKKADLSANTMSTIKVATLGDSDALKIGEPAIAIGNALGYGQSVTTGVISALHRDISMENTWNSLIQTNAAINPGNSGGALLNIKGEVVGINSNKIGGSTVEGMGYAIPISDVRDVIEVFMNRNPDSRVDEDDRGYLGVGGTTVDAATVENFGIPEGVYITKVYEMSAALDAGLCKGDVITKLDGQSVKAVEELQEILSYYKGGDKITVTVMRPGPDGYEELEVEVILGTKQG